MLSTKRRLTGVVLGSLLALGGTAAIPAAAHATVAESPARAACRPNYAIPNQFIYERWNRLGGQNGMLGCPIGANKRLANGAERQRFENGEIAWSPDQGHRMVVAAWERNGYAFFNWGPTDPYSYSVFLVRYTSAADAGGTQRELRGGNTGGMWVQKRTSGDYSFIVEGCDLRSGGHRCLQHWTVPVSTRN
ncbi:LGFP repeat-containing protein [Streptomyces sp. NPDC048504]|uniref:LGFP repeat-containing protein n=1 Tax=Streptomyces sp. NPDC048504 TaxID=3365559 RepID=UPI003715D920